MSFCRRDDSNARRSPCRPAMPWPSSFPPNPTALVLACRHRPPTVRRHGMPNSARASTTWSTPAAFPEHILRYRNQRWAERVGLDALTTSEWTPFRRFEPLPGSFDAAAGAALPRPPVPHLQPRPGRRPRFPVRAAPDGRRPPARPRHQGLGPHALVARRRRAADAQGRRARGAGDRDARGARRRHLEDALSLIETGEELERGDEPSPTRSAVLVRLSHSHVRIGTFQRLRLSRRRRRAARLLDYAVAHLLPDAGGDERRGRGAPRRGGRRVARDRRAMDRRGLRPRRAQHRQHQHHRRELRLRPVALRADLRSRRSPRPISIRPGSMPSAASPAALAVEPDAAGRVPAAAGGQAEAGVGAQQFLAGVPARARRGRRRTASGLLSAGQAAEGRT